MQNTIIYNIYNSPLGEILVAKNGDKICFLSIVDIKENLAYLKSSYKEYKIEKGGGCRKFTP